MGEDGQRLEQGDGDVRDRVRDAVAVRDGVRVEGARVPGIVPVREISVDGGALFAFVEVLSVLAFSVLAFMKILAGRVLASRRELCGLDQVLTTVRGNGARGYVAGRTLNTPLEDHITAR